MNLQEATLKAQQPAMQADGTVNKETYAIQFEQAESAKSLVGKELRSRKVENKNVIEIVDWVGQNYVICTNGQSFDSVPVVYLLSKLNNFVVSAKGEYREN
jgi:hypothetical protein